MAKVIKGITVEIGGNATPLNHALNDVNKTSKNLQSELRTIDKLLKLDPTNVELLNQKQEVLSESISTTEEKLRRLKSAEDKVAQAFDDGKIDAEQYRAFQRNIVTTEQKLSNLKDELNKTGQAISNMGTDADKSEKKLDDYKKQVDDVKEAVSGLKDKAKDTAMELGAGITAAGGAASAAIMSFDSVESALNHLQTQTGLSNSEIEQLRTVLETVYENNFGEDMQGIANVMASVAQYTGETDASKIKEITENVFTLSDAFEYDYAESLRTMKMLMDQFGVSSEEAFNLIVQGTQRGLNKNGDLLDTINEYSVHYRQLGYTAEEFFNSLENGTSAGTFSVDKLGDAVKEFGIRTKDTASSTVEAFSLLGYSAAASSEDIEKAKDEVKKLEKNLYYAKEEQKNFNDSTSDLTKQKNADKIAEYSEQLDAAKNKLSELTESTDGSNKSMEELQAKFAAGGDSAREATNEVLEQLFALDDQVLQNQIGVDLFGSLWEDLGIDGVKALMNVAGEADKTTDSMNQIKDIEYDDIGNRLEALGRKIQTEIINPAVKDFYPEAENFIDWASDNLDTLIPILEGIARQAGIIWTSKKANELAKSISNIINAYKTLKVATDTAKVAQEGLNFAQKANVIGLVVTAVGTLANVLYTLHEANNDAENSTERLSEKQKQLKDDITKLQDANNDFTESIKNHSSNVESEFKYYDDLWNELQGIVDQNGNIKKGYEERAEYITNKLSTVTGSEIEITDGAVQKYGELRDTLQEVIDKKKAEAMLSAFDGDYNEAQKNLYGEDGAESKYISALTDIDEYNNQLKEAEKELKRLEKEFASSSGADDSIMLGKIGSKKDEIQGIKDNINRAKEKADEAESLVVKYKSTIANYDTLSSSIMEGNAKKINASLNKLKYGFIDAAHGTKSTLKAQTDDLRTRAKQMQKLVDEGAEGVTQAQVDVLNKLAEESEKEYNKLDKKTNEHYSNQKETTREGIDNLNTEAGKLNVSGTVERDMNAAVSNMNSKGNELSGSMSNVANNTQRAAKIDGWSLIASIWIDSIISGIFGRNNDVENAGRDSAAAAKNGANSISLFSLGNNLVSGFINGILSGESFQQIAPAAISVAKVAYDTIKKWLGINSPSRKTIEIGEYFSEGFSVGIGNEADSAIISAEQLAENTLSALKAREKIINNFNKLDTVQKNNVYSLSSAAPIRLQNNGNNIQHNKQINLGGLTLKIEHFENNSATDVNVVMDKFMHAAENYISRRDAFK